MKLFEMKKLPDKAGDAIIKIEDLSHGRKNEVINLRKHDNMDFFWLNDNLMQFLVVYPDEMGSPDVWFGGTDERPFLVHLQTGALCALIQNGPQGFYNALIPSYISWGEAMFKIKARRQGDFFALPINFSDRQLEGFMELMRLKSAGIQTSQNKMSLFDTRHNIFSHSYCDTRIDSRDLLFAKDAVLKAPDHKDLKLPGWNLIMQAEMLVNPIKAD